MVIASVSNFITRRATIIATATATLLLATVAKAQELPVVRLVKDINPGSPGSDADMFVTLGGVAYFRANDGPHGYELWRSDGTEAGTQMVVDLNPGSLNGFPDRLAVVNGKIYFNAFNTSDFLGSKIWQSDGTEAGTILLADTFPGLIGGGTFGPPLPDLFTALNANTVLFSALDPAGGLEPWKTDGTPAGTARIIDLHPGKQWSIPVDFTVLHGVAYFAADDSVVVHDDGTATYNRELFRTDGTEAGTYRVKDINPGSEPSVPSGLVRFDQQVFFRADDGAEGAELWRSDGTEVGTVQAVDLFPGVNGSFPEFLSRVRFRATESTNLAVEPGDASNTLVFLAETATTGSELFRSDGTEGGTHLVKDIFPGSGSSVPLGMTRFEGRIYFDADDGVHGRELWVTDGTDTGTQLLADLNPGPLRSGPQSFTVAGDRLFFVSVVPDDANFTVKTQLWMTGAAGAGPQMVYEEPGVSFGYAINHLTGVGHHLLFTAPNEVDAAGFSADTELFAISLN